MQKRLLLAVIFISSPIPCVFAQDCTPNPAPAVLKGHRPLEINPNVQPGKCGFLQFAWQDFLSLNWPALPAEPGNTTSRARGLPDLSKMVGQDDGRISTVWEQLQPNWYLFWPNNPPPQAAGGDSFAAWNQNAWLPAACGPLQASLPPGSSPPRILSSLSKFDAMPGVAQAFAAPLIDQSGRYVRYEILLDYQAFNYINSNQFYLLPQVQAFAQLGQPFQFPVQNGDNPGATFIKAAWKVLSAADINSHRYHTAEAFLFTPAPFNTQPTDPNIQPTCAGPVTVGLVGLHIVHKTQGFPMWLWATFEQVDTTPADPDSPGTAPPEGWGFFQPGSPKAANQAPICPDGTTPLIKCDFQPTSSHMGTAPNDKTGGPVQTKRLTTISNSQNQPALGQINAAVQSALRKIDANNVWQFYQLVEAQWQSSEAARAPCTKNTGFFPACNVANMTMETYQQKNSCMSCHKPAAAPSGPPPSVSSDLTFELGLAWKPNSLPAPNVPGALRPTRVPRRHPND